MSVDDMVLCLSTGMSAGMLLKLMVELLFFFVRKFQSWLAQA